MAPETIHKDPSFGPTHAFVSSDDRGEFETDTRWQAIDKYTYENLHPTTRPSHTPLEAAVQHAKVSGLEDIASPTVVAKFFALQARLLNVTHALEVGLLGGYSALWMLLENPQLEKLTTLENDPECARIARENFEKANIDPSRYEIILAPGVETMPKLHAEIQSGKRPRFGFAFIDADKSNNWTYFDWAVKMSIPGKTCVIVDNVVSKGRLADAKAAEHDHMAAGGRKVVEEVGKDERVDATVMQVVSEKDYDGFLFAAVR